MFHSLPVILDKRTCGGCKICCWVSEIPFLDGTKKPTHTDCRHFCTSGCNIYGSPERPNVCQKYECAWLRGFGKEEDRPDKNGVMVSIGELNGGTFVFVVEIYPNALETTGRLMVLEMAYRVPLPIVVSNHDARPPHDTGNRVVLNNNLLYRAKNMIGAELGRLDDNVKIYELKNQA